MAIYESNGWFFADEVDRAFGENLVVPGVGLVAVLPANDYVRQHGRNLTKRAVDVTTASPCAYCLNNDGSHQSWCPRHPSRN